MDYQTDNTVQQVITRELSGGERLLWSGKPRQGMFLRREDAIAIPLGALWFGFSCVWELQALKSGKPFMILWGVPFVLIGLYIFVGRFFWEEYVRRNTYYGLTERRAILVQKGLRSNVRSVAFVDMLEISFSEGPGDRGTITFGPEAEDSGWSNDSRKRRPPELIQIENGREVYDRILRLKGEAAPSAERASTGMFRF
jgi:hypothetical protein